MDAEEQVVPRKRSKGKEEQKYIHEDPEQIVDLADINALSKITCKLKNIKPFQIIFHNF